MSNIVFTIPLSISVSYIGFRIMIIIGPINIPNIPMHLYPVYIAINVIIGCIPICLLTTFGSNSCLTTVIIAYSTIRAPARFISPWNDTITAQGIITVPEPSIGSASENAIKSAINNGYVTFNPNILNANSPD